MMYSLRYINVLCIALPKTIPFHISQKRDGILFESYSVTGELITRHKQKNVMEAKERSTVRKTFSDHSHFYLDMRFWLIILMLAAFVSFLLFLTPGK